MDLWWVRSLHIILTGGGGGNRPQAARKTQHETVTHACGGHSRLCLSTAFQSECPSCAPPTLPTDSLNDLRQKLYFAIYQIFRQADTTKQIIRVNCLILKASDQPRRSFQGKTPFIKPQVKVWFTVRGTRHSTLETPRAYFHVVGMLRFMFLT